ncbi:hypothetical protein AUK04_03650 [Candidatus Roizmanbacteria bacterium CG2_30_33_16]|uniref:Uncharacterized protein n=5 Tax=Candidatus Roizmaniibacteriota TaxID=1752723 RepID=A0A2M7E5F5_9BACT|nr:hypothetical protein [Candidatus Roizmanbacteria bacterium]OIP83198.1 MAG: hypothetical protein AUK04_03650 [Candidatus Roizmanbacteria bacterium CG2_30_33_16]PIP64879.1 MAG: hypothetical protein COW96_00125 [Candidatus Roizmanbacteria bacterium CG22_combo_CG10-13_8_21_14_all_33_16]PIV62960.1 MAG: hypothetical protein COS12_00435 [Candidatus Roizmanbacteria bacterium CG01_land_8_20_14_3_00_33_9]PIX72170.1 MAG: hypothetical protein COZ39_03260 [Candidatus Roizmanbacteria bacterium CG_4_10_14_
MTNRIIELQNELRKKTGEDKIVIGVPKNIKPRKFNKAEFIKAAKEVKSIFDEDNINNYTYAS